jgi:hypothetical protein
MEAAAMTAGPVRNLTAIAKAAMEFPHAMILGCKAMNRPVKYSHQKHHQHAPSPPSHPPLSVCQSFERPFIITSTTTHHHHPLYRTQHKHGKKVKERQSDS